MQTSLCQPVYSSCVATLVGPTGPTGHAGQSAIATSNIAILNDFVSQTQVRFGQVSIKLPSGNFISYQLYTYGNVARLGIAIIMGGNAAYSASGTGIFNIDLPTCPIPKSGSGPVSFAAGVWQSAGQYPVTGILPAAFYTALSFGTNTSTWLVNLTPADGTATNLVLGLGGLYGFASGTLFSASFLTGASQISLQGFIEYVF